MEKSRSSHTIISARSQNTPATIGLLTRGVAYPGHEALWTGVVEACRQHDVHLITVAGGLVHPPDAIAAQANIAYDLVDSSTFDGLLIWFGGIGWYLSDKERVQFCQRYAPLPCVSIEELIPGVPSVLKENLTGMRAAVAHLIREHGCRKIAFLQGPEGVAWAEERYQAYREALTHAGIPLEPKLIVPHSKDRDASGMEIAGYVQLRRLLDERGLRPGRDVDAIVSVNDYYAWQVITELQVRGLHVPRDLAVIGFDDDQESRVLTPPLTTVQNPMYAMGKEAVTLLLDRIDGQSVPEQVVVPAPLIIRQSCGCSSLPIRAASRRQAVETETSGDTAIHSNQETILAKLHDDLEELGIGDIPDNTVISLLEACLHAIRTALPETFLASLETFLHQMLQQGRDPATGQLVLSALRRQMTPFLLAQAAMAAEDLWVQASIIAGEIGQRIEAYHRVQAEKQGHLLREIGAKLITTFAVDLLMDALTEELPRLGISGCYLALYENSSEEDRASGESRSSVYSQSVPEWSRLILAYSEAGRLELPPAGQRFLSCNLRPSGVLPEDAPGMNLLLLLPLYFQQQQIGFVLLEPGSSTGSVCEALQVQISSALQGDLLVQRVQEHAAEVIRKNYILDTFMETVPDSIYFKDRESRFLQANSALAQLLGVQGPADLIGKTDFDFFPEDQARSKYEQEQNILSTGIPVLAVEEADAKGRWALTTKMPLRDEHGDIIVRNSFTRTGHQEVRTGRMFIPYSLDAV